MAEIDTVNRRQHVWMWLSADMTLNVTVCGTRRATVRARDHTYTCMWSGVAYVPVGRLCGCVWLWLLCVGQQCL